MTKYTCPSKLLKYFEEQDEEQMGRALVVRWVNDIGMSVPEIPVLIPHEATGELVEWSY